MSRFERITGVLPHEAAFGAFLAIITARLADHAGITHPQTLLHLAFLVIAASLVAWCRSNPSDTRWRWRLLFYPVVMNLIFVEMRSSVPLIHPGKEDLLLQAWDAHLFGGNLSLGLESWISPPLTEALSFCYVLFFPYLLFAVIWYLKGPVTVAKRFFSGLFTLYAVGFLGYTLLPALGPYLAMAGQFSVPLKGYWITALNAGLYPKGTNYADVFPSLHCAVSAYILMFDFGHKRWRFLAYLPFCLGLWLSTLYLRYHYAVDVLAGFALAAVAFSVVRLDWANPATETKGS